MTQLNKAGVRREIRAMDRITLAERVSRGLELEQLPQSEDGMLISGGATIGYALEEARLAFLHGFWISAILTSLTALEHHVMGRLADRDVDVSGLSPQSLVDQLRHWKMMEEDEGEVLLKVFECGDLYRQPVDAVDMSRRLSAAIAQGLTESEDFGGVMELDARFVVSETVEYFYRHCAVQQGSMLAEHAERRRTHGHGVITLFNGDDESDDD